jgi:hypothetical protein
VGGPAASLSPGFELRRGLLRRAGVTRGEGEDRSSSAVGPGCGTWLQRRGSNCRVEWESALKRELKADVEK